MIFSNNGVNLEHFSNKHQVLGSQKWIKQIELICDRQTRKKATEYCGER